MRPPISSATARDLSRLCVRCRLRVRRASSLAVAAPRRAITRPDSEAPIARASIPYYPALQQRRELSQSAHRPSDLPSPSTPLPQTHYDLFPETLPEGPPPAGHFPINVRALRREFLQLQARAHPDMHPPELKTRAEATSARINEAFKTLSNPLLRAQYLLSLQGVDVANDESLKVEEPDLLMLVLEAREEIEEAEGEHDLDEPRRVNDERIAESEELLEQAFKHDDVDAAKHEAVRLRYWVNIKESLDNWEEGKHHVLEH
ncbi:Fc.00g063960.m01.CDS01 [Cosmosporella sp. VM-42]